MVDDSVKSLAGWLTDEHARLVKARFGLRRYVAQDVDAFVADAVARLGLAEPPEPSWVRAVLFRTVTDLRVGYDVRAVDALLDELAARLVATGGGPDLDPRAAEMISLVEGARFRRSRVGYDYKEVDVYLAEVAGALARGHRPGPAPTFTVTRRGYDRRDVDAFLQGQRFTA
ncbi:hypothetical protein GCM10009839_66610 [Catenulispora yoronensis]|uniref:DivIVA domain-containing protein n=1 Tax=Catenulispora yoronensis TaxID=450799 RepID=A0ABP5GQ63_9ACTN